MTMPVRFTSRGLLALLLCSVASAQPGQDKGAKAIFLDTRSGRMVVPLVSPGTSGQPAASARVPAITGLMYYFELLQPNGELVRVNAGRVFHSGERVRLHVTTNIDGYLTILQSQGKRGFEELFPSPKLQDSTPFVRKTVETILPSPDSWFKFDDQPGEIRLLMMLTGGDAAPPPPLGPIRTAATEERVESIRSFEKLQRGSKALMIETDASLRDGAEIRIVNSAMDRDLPPGRIVVELNLRHRARD